MRRLFTIILSGAIINLMAQNVSIPEDVAGNNDAGTFNVSIGYYSGGNLTTGSYNVLMGLYAGLNLTSGSQNTFIGTSSGRFTETGSYNVFQGAFAGYSNVSGSYNTHMGYYTALNQTTGDKNTYMGSHAARYSTKGESNSFFGSFSGWKNVGDHNTFIGQAAGYSNISGGQNVFVGKDAGLNNESGNLNVFIGTKAGALNKTGTNNTCLGYWAGYGNNGNSNVFLGSQSGQLLTDVSNKLVIGNHSNSYLIYGDFIKNHVAIGTIPPQEYQDKFTLYVEGDAYATGYWTSSDARLKKDIKQIHAALDKIAAISGYEYRYKKQEDIKLPETAHIGFLAQELQKVLPQSVKELSNGALAVDYTTVIPVMLEAIKELNARITEVSAGQTEKLNLLEQETSLSNIPNPGDGASNIHYKTMATDTEIHVFDLQGRLVKSFSDLGQEGSVEVTTRELGAGLFHYVLVSGGEILLSKKMLLK